MDENRERDLEKRLSQGHDGAFWALMQECHRVMDVVVLGIDYFRHRPVEREEAVIAAADRAYERRRQYDGSGRFRAWLARLAWNEAHNRIPTRDGRRHRRRAVDRVPLEPEDGRAHAGLSTNGGQDRQLLLREVSEGLDRLDERERLSISLFFVEGYRDKEIAGILGVSNPRDIAPMRHRALARLRRQLNVRTGTGR